MARFITALTAGEGSFQPAELCASDARLTDLAADLAEARSIGAFRKEDWEAVKFRLSMIFAPDDQFRD